ncbi:MAG: glycosyltransferase family 4 protein [Sphingomonadales bacterium]|nr:glycosyltransferase family 4 protein [Sphingomonadales bacterium]
MKTLYLHGSPDFYGSGKVLLEILRIPGNAEQAIVVFPHEGPLCEPIKKMGIAVHIINMGALRKKYFTPQGVIGRVFLWIAAIIKIRQLIKKEKIERLYINSLTIVIGPWLKTNRKMRLIWHLHEIVERPRVLTAFLGFLLRRADQRIAVSKAAQTHWQTLLAPLPVDLLYNGIDLELGLDASEQEVPGNPDLVIGMIGRIQERKGQSYLLRILDALRKDSNYNSSVRFKVLIAGDAYPGYEHLIGQLEQEILELGLQDQVRYIGYQEDMGALLSKLDLVVVPSTEPDSFPTVVLEAMKFSLPVLATRQGGCLEMIEENVSGFFIPLDNADASAKILANVLANKERLQEAGKKGRERVAALYSEGAFRTNWLRLVQS